MDIKPYISHIDDLDRRKLVTSVLDSFEKKFVEGNEGDKLRMGINHGDFNDGNIVSNVHFKLRTILHHKSFLGITVQLTSQRVLNLNQPQTDHWE